jgi:hypothetical protein
MIVDLLKRFTPTPIRTTFLFQGTAVRLATNSDLLKSQLVHALDVVPPDESTFPEFGWNVIVEPTESEGFEEEPFDAPTLNILDACLIHIGRQNFLACDQDARQGISFISDELVNSESRFRSCFVPALLSLTQRCVEDIL